MRIHAAFGGIGSFAVKFRWFVLVAWVIAAVAVPRALPSLSSVTQGNNANFLPASAPSEHALKLAAPLGGSTLTPVPVVAASSQGALTAADQSLSLYPVDGGSPARPVPGWPAGATPIQWSADGAALFYALSSDIPGEIHRFDLATGRSQVWQQLAPGDLGGVQTITSPVITPDGHVYAYTFARLLGDLYVADWGSR